MRFEESETGSLLVMNADVPGVRLMSVDGRRIPHRGVKEHFTVSWMIAGRTESWRRGRTRIYSTGAIVVGQPGEVHNDRRIDSPVSYRIAAFNPERVERARMALGLPATGELDFGEIDPRSPEAACIRRMHRMLFAPQMALAAQEEAIHDALSALIGVARKRSTSADRRESRNTIRRAQDFMRARGEQALRIQDVADAAGVDQYRLIRAFRQHVGISPYEWLTHLRVQRAKALLAEGHSATDVAQLLGYCDQSQLHRHFRRIVGTTPGAYAREVVYRR
jgi:AraC-like DNA-binding protein